MSDWQWVKKQHERLRKLLLCKKEAACKAVRSGTERAEAWTLTIQRAFRELCAATMAPFSRLHGSKGVCCDHEHSERKLQALPTDSPDGLATKLHGAGGAHSDISSQSSCDSTSSGSEDSSTDASTPSSPSASLACVLSATKPSTDTGRPATTDTASPAEPAPITLSTAACQWDGHWPSTTRTPSCLVHTFDNDSALARALGVQGQLQLFAVATSPHPVEHPHVHQFLQLLPQRLNSFAADPYIPQRTLQGILAATLNEGWTHAWDGGDAGVGQRVCDLALVIAAPDEGRLWSCAVGDCRVMAKVAHGGVGVAGDWEDLTCDSTNPGLRVTEHTLTPSLQHVILATPQVLQQLTDTDTHEAAALRGVVCAAASTPQALARALVSAACSISAHDTKTACSKAAAREVAALVVSVE